MGPKVTRIQVYRFAFGLLIIALLGVSTSLQEARQEERAGREVRQIIDQMRFQLEQSRLRQAALEQENTKLKARLQTVAKGVTIPVGTGKTVRQPYKIDLSQGWHIISMPFSSP
jgi:cytochrome c biogenesis protein ResB